METDPRRWIQALRASHDALMAQIAAISSDQLATESYCRGWDVGQVLSHLGSGAEISLLGLEKSLAGRPPLDHEEFPIIWGRWNGLSPSEKATEMVVWDRRGVSVWQSLDDKTISSLRVPMLGINIDVATTVGFRLGEHALHSWDVAVTVDPTAEVLGSSAELLVDRAPFLAGRLGKPEGASSKRLIEVRTVHPERHFLLSIGDVVTLEAGPGDGQPDGKLELSAAALLRLVYGRLDAEHTPPGVKTEGTANLDELRRVFPGF